MFTNKLPLYLSIYFLLITNIMYAQDHIIHGVVHTFDSIPLIGAEIKVKSTNQSFFTDKQGNFMIFCNTTDRLKVLADGFYSQSVNITEKTKIAAINLHLKTKAKNHSAINYIDQQKYAIGYGYVSDLDKTTASSSLNTNDATFVRYSNMYDLIRGQFAGVEVTTEGSIIIRGGNSLRSNNNALVVVDDVIVSSDILGTLSPTIVKNIYVIKDGTAAIYGSRGANGVLLIETKKGGDEL